LRRKESALADKKSASEIIPCFGTLGEG